MTLAFDEIQDDKIFEDLTAEYFRDLKDSPDNNITNVEVKASGEGSDGGRDILIEIDISDDIKVFKRKWVIQCKFREDSISTTHLKGINIPTLIHSYNAHGYLLVCKTRPTSGVTELFERLNEKCKDQYQYEYWNGTQFLKKILLMESLHQTFFPKYFNYVQSIKNKKK